ncbi:MAG: restriction endonuclease [Acholeplasma sp.]|nr:restriction endonuclease [Acholeplasma sp.]
MSFDYIEIFEKIDDGNRLNYNLVIDRVYKANQKPNFGADVISKLFPVGVSGGFRILGKQDSPKLVILFTTGEDPYWKDEVDEELGYFIYYGDNQRPGKDLHDTKLGGNKALKTIFSYASDDNFDNRVKIPPIFIFKKHSGRDVRFLGLAIPGIKSKPEKEWLTAVWASKDSGGRFQNYKAYFTILNTSSGSSESKGPEINLAWINDIVNDKAYESVYAPNVWKDYIRSRKFTPLMATKIRMYKTKEEQIPYSNSDRLLLNHIQAFYYEKDRGYGFEKFAIELAKRMNPSILEITNTRPTMDGGFDGVGKYRIFDNIDNSVTVEFYLEAKCYNLDNSVGVKETSRLISRIKNRQFGILFTTSYIGKQAYQEIIEDGHPIVIITGKDIINHLTQKEGILNTEDLRKWISTNHLD